MCNLGCSACRQFAPVYTINDVRVHRSGKSVLVCINQIEKYQAENRCSWAEATAALQLRIDYPETVT